MTNNCNGCKGMTFFDFIIMIIILVFFLSPIWDDIKEINAKLDKITKIEPNND